ncbi:type II toxin-antitoxin system RelE/ParE family toxin [Caulobacter segnis]|uniref:type II toxin-antitoxin system RelE/ParE family toxin n=1 Tax=Caulobacter segnis TaxID=88688 RepID=UPI00240FEB2C|nr:type II toxin-antitoxin system RelE/ParE family toxin [Caulobacter segnis]MDG2520665.1 type II toxin-antitoxin system RelE/ParE family toxin [Caulobacter segnis]
MRAAFRVQKAAGQRLDEIYEYTRGAWGDEQAERYIKGLFAKFEDLAARRAPWRRIPAEFGVDGFFCRYEKHVIYWKVLDDGVIGIATVLHESMHQISRFSEDMGEPPAQT